MNRSSQAPGNGWSNERKGLLSTNVVSHDLRGFAAGNVALLFALAATLLIAIRILASANLDPITAIAIVQNVGPGFVLQATAIVLLPIVVAVGFAGAFALVLRHGDRVPAFEFAFWIMACACFFLTPWIVWLSAGVCVLFLSSRSPIGAPRIARFIQRRSHRTRLRTIRRILRPLARVSALILSAYAIISLLTVQPWIAPEVVTINDTTQVAYVLKSDAESSVLLGFRDRRVQYNDSPIETRAVCSSLLSGFDGRSVFALLTDPKTYPACPKDLSER